MKNMLPSCLTLLVGACVPLAAQMSVSLAPSVSSPAPLGTPVTWSATVSNANPGTLRYRFRTRYAGAASRTATLTRYPVTGRLPEAAVRDASASSGIYRTVEDYGPNTSITWETIDQEGQYQIEVAVINNDTGDTATASAYFQLTPLASAAGPAITPTGHPLVFIYSAPPCVVPGQMSVQFQAADGVIRNTPSKACVPGISMNFYLAGMRATTPYTAQHTINYGDFAVSGPVLNLTTGAVTIPTPSVVPLTGAQMPSTDGILLQSLLQTNSIATDLSGNVIWYGPFVSFLTRPVAGGTFLGTVEDGTKGTSQQFVREFDFTGNTVAETNAERIGVQLTAMGMHPINSFHHEARKLPDGGYLVLADSERILTDVQGPGNVDVIGDTILVLDSNLQVTWAWDSFDHLDTHRMAVLGETCTYPANLSCAAFYLSKTANDWLHGNALQLTPDGNILYSMRHQDWVIKIDYENGAGTGDILWHLGQGGDFQINSSDSWPWFSHQHDANFESDGQTFLVFDDGNTRQASNPSAHSRGQMLQIDEPNHVATLVVNADLGGYSYALGSAQQLPDGNFHYDAGALPNPAQPGGSLAQSLEVNPSGSVVYGIQFATLEYRSFRMQDLYTAP